MPRHKPPAPIGLAGRAILRKRCEVPRRLSLPWPNRWLPCLLAPALLMGCVHHHHNKTKTEAKQIGLAEGEYRKLQMEAEGGNRAAAEKLARLWYQFGEGNEQALYWLDVAARNGSERAAKVAKVARAEFGE